MENHLTVILGAGFSANAGMPTANSIAERFNRDLRKKLLNASSSEWFWIDDKDENFVYNCRLSYDYLAYSYVFNELVKRYVADRGEFNNYEDFYQFILDNFINTSWVKVLFENAKNLLLADQPSLHKNYLYVFEYKQYYLVSDIFNYLISDILSIIPKNDAELRTIYQGFIDYITQFENVDIFTLNHDLLLEKILELNGLKFSKGFNIEGSPISYKNKPVPYFNNIFNEKIKIYKLHGSIDFFQFRFNDGTWSSKYDYFMTTDYYTKHRSIRINPVTKEVLQDYNSDIIPKFIAGTKKMDTIESDFLFKKLFQNFKESISKSTKLLISGYSFNDEHINEELKSKEFNFINHNPNNEYPFDGYGKNIKSLNDLKSVTNK